MRLPFCAPLLLVISLAASAQTPVIVKKGKPVPPTIANKPLVLLESTVTRHWPKMPAAINIPVGLEDLSPGQCVRLAAVSFGDGHAALLQGAQIAFTAHFGPHTDEIAASPVAATKEIKPEGYDQVSGDLAAGGLHYNLPTSAAIAASSGHWCVPADAPAGVVEFQVSFLGEKAHKTLEPVTLKVLSPENPPTPPFDEKTIGAWTMGYHNHPQAALLGVATEQITKQNNLSPIMAEFFIAAFQQDPATAARLGPWLAKTDRNTRLTVLALLEKANITLQTPPPISDDDKQMLAAFPKLPDPFVLSTDQEQFTKLDMLWANFTATGDFEPVQKLVGMLAWRPDYEAFNQLRTSHQQIPGLTPAIVRGVAYTAVGWSIDSFDRNDPLVADYIGYIMADPSTPEAVKKELPLLATDPAFKQARDASQ
jgi:hypothetical protein